MCGFECSQSHLFPQIMMSFCYYDVMVLSPSSTISHQLLLVKWTRDGFFFYSLLVCYSYPTGYWKIVHKVFVSRAQLGHLLIITSNHVSWSVVYYFLYLHFLLLGSMGDNIFLVSRPRFLHYPLWFFYTPFTLM